MCLWEKQQLERDTGIRLKNGVYEYIRVQLFPLCYSDSTRLAHVVALWFLIHCWFSAQFLSPSFFHCLFVCSVCSNPVTLSAVLHPSLSSLSSCPHAAFSLFASTVFPFFQPLANHFSLSLFLFHERDWTNWLLLLPIYIFFPSLCCRWSTGWWLSICIWVLLCC